MRTAIYGRVSTDKQDTDNQLLQLREFAARQGWTIAGEYCDYESGSKADRAQFQQMFTDASKRRFDLLLFWALDSLSREGALKTLQHLDRLEDYGVGFRSFTEPYFDSCGIFKEAVVPIVATLAKQERIKRSERTKAGLARVRSASRRLGRPRVAVNPAEIAPPSLTGALPAGHWTVSGSFRRHRPPDHDGRCVINVVPEPC